MRFLHTADWHLGKLFHQVHLTDDQAYVLDRLVEAVEETQPDLVLVAGDVFDRAIPPGEAITLLDEVLDRLVLGTGTQVVLIPGNHDDPKRLGFASRLLARAGLHVVVEADSEPLTFEDAHGEIRVAPFPWLHPSEALYRLGAEGSTHADAMAAMARHATARIPQGVRAVAVAHGWVTGGEPSESERPLNLGGSGEVPQAVFDRFCWVALGHLHRPQSFDGGRLHYPGSLLPYHFSEAERTTGVTLTEVGAEGIVSLERIPLAPRRGFRVVRGAFDELLAGDPDEAYIQAVLSDAEPIVDAAARLRTIFPNLLSVVREHAAGATTQTATAAEELARPIDEQFSLFFEQATSEKMEAEATEWLHRIAGEPGT